MSTEPPVHPDLVALTATCEMPRCRSTKPPSVWVVRKACDPRRICLSCDSCRSALQRFSDRVGVYRCATCGRSEAPADHLRLEVL